MEDLEVPPCGIELCGCRLDAVECGVSRESPPMVPLPLSVEAARVELSRRHGEERVEPKRVVVVEVLVSAGHAEDALGCELLNGVLDALRVAVVDEAAGDTVEESTQLRDLAQEDQAAIAGDVTRVESDVDPPPSTGLNSGELRGTLCLHRLASCVS